MALAKHIHNKFVNPWTIKEEQKLGEMRGSTKADLLKAFPDRTWIAILKKARRLGIKRLVKPVPWNKGKHLSEKQKEKRRRLISEKPRKYVPKECLTCKKVFNSYLGVQKYCSRRCRQKDYLTKLKSSNPETYAERLEYIENWRKTHPERVKIHIKRGIERRRLRRKELRGIPEKVLRGEIKERIPGIIDLDFIHPDFYDPREGLFVEVKTASKEPNALFSSKSKYLNGLYFDHHSSYKHSVDNQIEKYPRPLLVIVLDVYTGKELTRKKFT